MNDNNNNNINVEINFTGCALNNLLITYILGTYIGRIMS